MLSGDMAAATIYLVLLIWTIRCRCDVTTTYNNNGNGASQFGELLKPPPPPLSQILPVPFHGGAVRTQRQNADIGYHYQVPPPPPPMSQIPFGADFKFPAPFYKQYNFNFVPPPQPFSTTPAPSLFHKVSTWLFPSQQTSYDVGGSHTSSSNIAPIKKDCNPCNLVPWMPVLRYNLGSKNVHQSSNPTYGPPSPTAQAQIASQFRPSPFQQHNEEKRLPQLSPSVPHSVYGPPIQTFNNNVGLISSTYGPPSPTHTVGLPSQSPLSSTYSAPSYNSIPSSTYGAPSIGQFSSSYLPSISQGITVTPNYLTSTFGPPALVQTTPSPLYNSPLPITTYGLPNYQPGVINNDYQPQSNVEILRDHLPSTEQQLPNVSPPTEFKNSYGEVITSPYALDIPYPVSATAAESTKIKTEVLPNGSKPETPNISLANPAPFTLNRGRNIHTLQPVALPNLSVSPLPPIFNARPFRPILSPFTSNVLQGINQMQQKPNNVDIAQSVPLIEFTHSIDYPTTYVQSPVIDVESLTKINNQTKAYRNIPNHFVIDEIRDISSQASETHPSATKSNSDSSFESTGLDVGNDLYDNGLSIDMKQNVPSNHKSNFADLRGLKDEDVDKYRTESNLQNIDSPLLYLKPSAPHKTYGNFVLAVSTPITQNEYEMYDEVPTTTTPPGHSLTTAWEESRTHYSDGLLSPPINTYQPKIVQIIVPYTTGQKEEDSEQDDEQNQQNWEEAPEEDPLGRKAPNFTVTSYLNLPESTYPTTTVESIPTATESYESNAASILNDLYDVKEPPFDIVKLQHTIDDWTEQEYSKYKPQKTRSGEKLAKKIPDEYFTTTIPTNYVTETSNYYDFYDHEGSSSNQYTVTEDDNTHKPRNVYNNIERTKSSSSSGKNEDTDEIQKLHIYTAASSFRTSSTQRTTSTTTTTTPAPWGKIQTSISPLTKEKVYVVTSKPWRDARNITKEWYEVEPFESKKTKIGNDETASDELPFKSPRFMNRPSFGFTSGGKIESVKSDSSYGFSRSWYQSINELETKNNRTSIPEVSPQSTNSEEVYFY